MPLHDTINFSINKLKKITYQLQILADRLNENGLSAYLEDRYLHTSIPVNLNDTSNYIFTVDTAAGSYDKSRFRIVFKPMVVLPLEFTAINAYQINDKVQVDWKMQDEINTVKYEVEKSANGLDFSAVNTIEKNTTGSYSWQDANAFAAAILMPKNKLEEKINNSSLDLTDDEAVKKIAQMFDVSVIAMTYRIANLHIK